MGIKDTLIVIVILTRIAALFAFAVPDLQYINQEENVTNNELHSKLVNDQSDDLHRLNSIEDSSDKVTSTKTVHRASSTEMVTVSGTIEELPQGIFTTYSTDYDFSRNKTHHPSGIPYCLPQRSFSLMSGRCPHCTRKIFWLRLNKPNTCVYQQECPEGKQFSSSCLQCVPIGESDCSASANRPLHLDIFSCQAGSYKGKQESVNIPRAKLLCHVNGGIVRPCENPVRRISRVSWVTINHKLYFTDHNTIVLRQDLKNIKSYNCTPGFEEYAVKGECSGDLTYCNNFGCRGMTMCTCDFFSRMQFAFYKSKEHLTQIDCWGSSLVEKTENEPLEEDSNKITCSTCHAECQGSELVISTHSDVPVYFSVCKNPGCVSGRTHSSTFSVKLTKEMQLSRGDFDILVWFRDQSEPTSLTVKCKQRTDCEVLDCWLCFERIMNPHCYSKFHYMIGVGLSILTMWMINTVLRFFYNLVCLCRVVVRPLRLGVVLLVKMVLLILTLCKRPTYHKYSRVDAESAQTTSPPKTKPKTYSFKKSKYFSLFNLIFIMTLFSNTDCCSKSSMIKVEFSDCQRAGAFSECVIKTTASISVSPLGQDSCFNMISIGGKPLGSLILRTQSARLKCLSQILYYSPAAEAKCSSQKRCWKAGNCYGTNCESTKETDVFEGAESDMESLGWSGCSRVPGGWLNNCGLMNQGCLWWRKFFRNPEKKYVEVSTCSQWKYEIKVLAIKMTPSGSFQKELILSPSFEEEAFGVTLGLTSVSLPPTPLLGKCFARNNSKVSLTECNPNGRISSGVLGEIQCPTKEDAQYLTNKCFSSNRLITIEPRVEDAKCSAELVDLSSITSKSVLPLKLEGLTLTTEGESIFADFTSLALFSVTATFQNFKMMQKVDHSKCYSEFKSLRGCFGCLSGATLSIELNTDKGSTVGHLICSEYNISVPFVVSAIPKVYETTVKFQDQKINTKCIFLCPNNEQELIVQGDLMYIPNSDFRTSESISSLRLEAESKFEWPDLFSFSFWHSIKTTMAIILCLFFFSVLFYYLALPLIIRCVFSRSIGIRISDSNKTK